MNDPRILAGEHLAELLMDYRGQNLLILGLTPGGVIVGKTVAAKMGAAFDIIVAHDLTYEDEETGNEIDIGAISEEGQSYIDPILVEEKNITEDIVREVTEEESIEVEKKVELYRDGRSIKSLDDKTVILVSDHVLRGYRTYAALQFIQSQKPNEIVIAAPIILSEVAQELDAVVSDVVCMKLPESIEEFEELHKDFPPIDDDEVIESLKK